MLARCHVLKRHFGVPSSGCSSRELTGSDAEVNDFSCCTHLFSKSKTCGSNRQFPLQASKRFSIHSGLGQSSPRKIFRAIRAQGRKRFDASAYDQGSGSHEADIVIVGAGIVGLSIAHTLLRDTSVSVAIVDKAQPCAGATGAGQGYIWLGNRQPGTPAWDFAKWSKGLWEGFAQELALEAPRSSLPLGWVKNGSLLVAANGKEAAGLQRQVDLLQSAGLGAKLLSARETRVLEPALSLEDDGGAAFLPDDAQLDAELAVAALRARCERHAASGRYKELFYEPVNAFLWSSDGSAVRGIRTSKRSVRAHQSVVVATGAWTTDLLAAMSPNQGDLGTALATIKPRKGHLLMVEGPRLPYLKHALMECEYSANAAKAATAEERSDRLPQTPNPSSTEQSSETSPKRTTSTLDSQDAKNESVRQKETASSTFVELPSIPPGAYKPSVPWDLPPNAEVLGFPPSVSVSMTATSDAHGRLMIGSSREFSGFETGVRDETILAILERAARFLPALDDIVRRADVRKSVRTGLRPYAANGRPSIGFVPGVDGLLVAAGHEGSGLCMAPGTAAVIRDLLTGRTPEVDCSYFAPAAVGPLTKTELVK